MCFCQHLHLSAKLFVVTSGSTKEEELKILHIVAKLIPQNQTLFQMIRI